MATGLDYLMDGDQPQATGLDLLLSGAPVALPGPSKPIAPARTNGAVLDAGNAVGTGYWRGMLRLAGLPVDTVMNVADLAKAGAGAVYGGVTGKAPPDMLLPSDRSKIVGTGDYFINKSRAAELGRLMIDPANPDFEGGYLQASGGAMAGGGGQSIPNAARNLSAMGASGLTAKAVMDATGDPALASAASFGPQVATTAAAAGAKMAVRGGEAGRREMQQRITDLRNAGVENPTMGLASGNGVVGGIENLLQSTPGAVGVMGDARARALGGLLSKVTEAADTASPVRGANVAGAAIQSGIQDFKAGFKDKQGQLYDVLDQHVPPGTPSNVNATVQTLADLNAPIPGAPNTSKLFRNARIGGIEDAINADLTQSKTYTPSQLAEAMMGKPQNGAAFNAALGEGQLPYEAVKKTRTLVGNEIADNSLMSDVPRSKWNPLYGALSEDLQDIAAQSGPDATKAFNRANDYTRAGIDRLDRLAPFANATAPEQAYTSLMNSTKENVSTLQAVKKSLPEGARGQVAGTVIERLGKANPSNQNDLGDVFSTERFLTNWNSMTPKARDELFSGFPNSDRVRADVEAAAKATSMMRDSSKMWANPSGTGANTMARNLLLGGAAAAGGFNPIAPVIVGGAMGGANLLGRLLTSQSVVDKVARPTTFDQARQAALARALLASGTLKQPE